MKNHHVSRKARVFSVCFFLVIICFRSIGIEAQEHYAYKYSVTSGGEDTLYYRCLQPENLRSGKKYPLVLFLHGAGERGNDNETQLKHGSGLFLNPVNREKFPAFVIFPQCPKKNFGPFIAEPSNFDGSSFPETFEMSPFITLVKKLLDDYMNKPEIDKDRIYIIGLSMGAMGVYDMVCRFPELFAAAVPICGSVNVQRLPQAKKVSFRIFHGEKDPAVPVECSRRAYETLKRCVAKVEYIEFYGCDHFSWNPAFNFPDFMDWLFEQQK